MSDLFRSEAIQHQTRRLNGEVILASSISSRILAGLLVAVIVAAAWFASTASYARKETLPGWLAPESGVIRLSARQGGLIEKIHVREGDVVSAGQPIATISLLQQLDSGASYTTLKTSLDSQRSAAAARAGNMMASLGLEKSSFCSVWVHFVSRRTRLSGGSPYKASAWRLPELRSNAPSPSRRGASSPFASLTTDGQPRWPWNKPHLSSAVRY